MGSASAGGTGVNVPTNLQLPAPTAWPVVLAFGITLVFAGLVTSASVSVLGAILSLTGALGWFRNVLPHEAHESVPVLEQRPSIETTRREVARLEAPHALKRAQLPLEIYPVSAGIKGGLAGGVVMALLAMGYGVVSGTGVWYPINLLAAGFFPAAVKLSTSEIAAFHLSALAIATLIHLITSLLVGLLYGAMLPMLPRRPILLGGLVVPLVWSALFYGIVGVVNPVFKQHVAWPWFVVCQIGFGVVAGLVVSRRERVKTWQGAPLVLRAGVEATGLDREPGGGTQR